MSTYRKVNCYGPPETAAETPFTDTIGSGATDVQESLEWLSAKINTSTKTFEAVSKNLKSFPFTLIYNVSGDVSTITYDLGGALSIVKTFGYTGDNITTITLSGDTPVGINLVKTLVYDVSGNFESANYT